MTLCEILAAYPDTFGSFFCNFNLNLGLFGIVAFSFGHLMILAYAMDWVELKSSYSRLFFPYFLQFQSKDIINPAWFIRLGISIFVLVTCALFASDLIKQLTTKEDIFVEEECRNRLLVMLSCAVYWSLVFSGLKSFFLHFRSLLELLLRIRTTGPSSVRISRQCGGGRITVFFKGNQYIFSTTKVVHIQTLVILLIS